MSFVHPRGIPQVLPGLEEEFQNLFTRSLADNTRNVYASGLKLYESFLFKHSLTFTLPIPTGHILNFILHMSKQGYAHKTIVSYVESLSYLSKCNSYIDNTKHFLIKKILEGHRRGRPCKDTRAPITLDLLLGLSETLSSVCSNYYEACLFRAMFSLAFWGLLRVGEFTQSRGTDLSRLISMTDVRLDMSKKIIHLLIRWSKTDQAGIATTLIISAQSKKLCPYDSLNDYLALRPNVSGPLFIHFDKSVVTRYQFTKILQRSLALINGDGKKIRSHSFRIGGATYLNSLGKSEIEIQRMGRWRSCTYKKYIRL